MPDKLRQDDIELLRRSPLFDDAYYLRSNPDLAAKGVDPVKHYLRRGAAQGRDPSPDFSTTGYLRSNQDISKSGVNPLVHYLRHGQGRGAHGQPVRGRGRDGGGVGLLRRGLLPPLLPGAADRRGPGRPLPPRRRRARPGPERAVLDARLPRQNPDVAVGAAQPARALPPLRSGGGPAGLPQPDAPADVRDALPGAVAAPAADAARPRADPRAAGHRAHRQRRTPPASSAASGPRSSWASCSPTAPAPRSGWRPAPTRRTAAWWPSWRRPTAWPCPARSSSATSRSTAPARCPSARAT